MPRDRDQAVEDAQQLERHRTAPWMIGAIRRQLDRGYHWLRFEPALEREFAGYLNRSARTNRIVVMAIAVVVLLFAPVFDSQVFGLAPSAMPYVRWLQYVGMLSVPLLAIAWCLRWPDAPATEAVMALQVIAMSAGLIGTRVLLAGRAVDFPIEFMALGFAGMAALGRIRARIMIPIGVLLALVVLIVEVMIVQPPRAQYYHAVAAGTLGLITIYLQYVSEYSLRGSWLDRRLLALVSRRDGLTGLFNRQALESALAVAHAHAVRERLGYGLAMIDIDQFGRYNDGYGHPAGDQALREVAHMLESYARRPLDVCGRYGGEEFSALWIGESAEELEAHAENLRAAIQALHIDHKGSKVASWITVSIGMCYVSAPDECDSLSAVLATADRLLYEAKGQGRNCVVADTFKSPSVSA